MKIVYGEWLSYVGTYITCALGLYIIKSFTVIHTWSKVEKKKKCYVYINNLLNVLQLKKDARCSFLKINTYRY